MLMNFIKSIIFSVFFSLSFIMAEEKWKENFIFERSTSFGFMSEKLGTDFWNFSWTIYKKENDEIFISIGPSVFIPTNAGIGWKHYFKTYGKQENIKPFSSMSIFSRSSNKMSNNSGDAIRDDDCIGVSGGISYFVPKLKKRRAHINVGVFVSYDFRNKPFVLPVINVEFKKLNKE